MGCDIDDATWRQLGGRFSKDGNPVLAGFYRMVSYLTNALRLAPEPFARRFPLEPCRPARHIGDRAVVPDGVLLSVIGINAPGVAKQRLAALLQGLATLDARILERHSSSSF